MNTQKEIIKVIHNQKGDYIGDLKVNHTLLYGEAKAAFDKANLKNTKKREALSENVRKSTFMCKNKRVLYDG